jgi:deoxycytidylate deaminase
LANSRICSVNDHDILEIAESIAEGGKCSRRKIGCVLADRGGGILGIGTNGPPEPLGSCLTSPCPDAHIPAGQGAKKCYAIHAEEVALNRAEQSRIYTAYTNKAPCLHCTLLLLATPCKRIVFRIPSNETANGEVWKKAGREWIQLDR